MSNTVNLRQGVIESWDSSTGACTLRIAGGQILNAAALKAGAATLDEGDVVTVLSATNQHYILGPSTTPGDPGTVPSWNVDITALTGQVDTIQTVTIPAVQNDVVIVQGDVIELNTVTVPAVQAVADAAQADADAAVSTAAGAASDAAAAQAAAAAAQADADALQTALDAVEADVTTLTGTTLPALQSDLDAAEAAIVAAQADVDAILPIGTTDISDDAITTPKIAANAVTAAEIAADTITASQIAASAITASELAANAVTAGKIAAGTIVAADIAASTITAAKIAAGTITATELAANAVTATKIAATAIDGKTITGALIRTAASGQRVEVSSTVSGKLQFYSGNASETAPGELTGRSSGTQAIVELSSGAMSGVTPSELSLYADSSIAQSTYRLDGTFGQLRHTAAGSIQIGDGTNNVAFVGNAITGADLSSSTNTFPANPQPVEVVNLTTVTVTSPALTPTFAPGSPVCGVPFTAPATGSVYITVGGRFQNDTATNTTYLGYEVRTGGTVGSGTVFLAAEAASRSVASGTAASTRTGASRRRLVTGLTPGSSYNVRTMHAGQIATGGATIFNRELLVEPVL